MYAEKTPIALHADFLKSRCHPAAGKKTGTNWRYFKRLPQNFDTGGIVHPEGVEPPTLRSEV